MKQHTFFLLFFCMEFRTSLGWDSKECFSPFIENGWVEAEENVKDKNVDIDGMEMNNMEENSEESRFDGLFRCHPGFALIGETTVRCRNGKWNINQREFPFCAVLGSCDVTEIQHILNGYLIGSEHYKESVFRYECEEGYQIVGPTTNYCTKLGWSLNEAPFCAKTGCDPQPMLEEGLKYGWGKPLFGGAVYSFHCFEGSVMFGSPQVFCNGNTWIGNRPQCFVAPTVPDLLVFVDGILLKEQLAAAAGRKVKVSCMTSGGYPFPTVTLVNGNQMVNEDSLTFNMTEEQNNLSLSCGAENIVSKIFSTPQVLKLKYAPRNTYLEGAEEILIGETAEYFCSSDESLPAAKLSLVATDQIGNYLPVTNDREMSKYIVELNTDVLLVEVECRAANEIGRAVSFMSTFVKYPPKNITIKGPKFVPHGEESVLSCEASSSNPEPLIQWEVTEDEGDSKIEKETEREAETVEHGAVKTVSKLIFQSSNSSSVMIRCIISIEQLQFKTYSRKIELIYTSLPTSIEIKGPSHLEINKNAEFTCVSEGGNPKPQISMTTNQNFTIIGSDGLGGLSVNIPKNLDVESLNINCVAKNQAGSLQTTTTVPVHWAPTIASVTGPEIVVEGETAEFFCEVSSSNPPAAVTWRVSNSKGQNVEFETDPPDGNIHHLKIPEVDRSKGLEVTCMVNNSLGFMEKSVTTIVSYLPEDVFINGADAVIVGEEEKYECIHVDGHPMLHTVMTVEDSNGNVIISEDQKNITVSLHKNQNLTFLTVTCEVNNLAGSEKKFKIVPVHWPPTEMNLAGPDTLMPEETALYICDTGASSPSATLSWEVTNQDGLDVEFKNGSKSIEIPRKATSTANDGDKSYTVLCKAENYIGYLEKTINTLVLVPPMNISLEGPDTIIAGENSKYSCIANGHPTPNIHMNVEPSNINLTWNEESGKSTLNLDKTVNTTSVTIFCAARNEAGSLDKNKTIHIHRATTFVTVTGPDTVPEGDGVQYMCAASKANPPAEIIWTVTNESGKPVKFTEDTGKINVEMVTRKDRRLTVLCKAANYIGFVEHSLSTAVSYGPSSLHLSGPDHLVSKSGTHPDHLVLKSGSHPDHLVLKAGSHPDHLVVKSGTHPDLIYTCSADFSQPAANLTWYLNNEEIKEGVETNILEEEGIKTVSTLHLPQDSLESGKHHMISCNAGTLSTNKTVSVKEHQGKHSENLQENGKSEDLKNEIKYNVDDGEAPDLKVDSMALALHSSSTQMQDVTKLSLFFPVIFVVIDFCI